jgi:hypothetical protein
LTETSGEIKATTTDAALHEARVAATSASPTTQPEPAFASAERQVQGARTAQAETPAPAVTAPHAAEVQPQPVETPAPPPVIVAGEFVREESPAPASKQAGPAARPEEVLTLDWQTDLTQIETNPGKIRAVQVQAVEDSPALRPKRVRPAPTPLDEGPLLQVETHPTGPATPAPGP